MFPYLKISEAIILERIMSASANSVATVLKRNGHGFDDLLTLLSPAAARFLPLMRETAAACRRMYFGKAIQLYTPLYISSNCINGCLYCDFNRDNSSPRKTLSISQIIDDARVIKSMGIDSLLLVAGEDPKMITVDFLEKVAIEMKKIFSYLSIEIAPQSEKDYRRLYQAGVDGLTLFQETFDRELYAELHPFGPKRDYDYRLEALQRGGAAGMRTIGMAFLLGLYDWRIEAASLAAQAIWIKRKYYRSRIQFTFPRITLTSTGFVPPAPVTDAELEQMMLAFRIVFPEYDMTLSTREGKEFRNHAAITCVNNLSAGSLVSPGAYSESDNGLGQFSLNDTRTVSEMMLDMRKLGLDPVTKYWDASISNGKKAS